LWRLLQRAWRACTQLAVTPPDSPREFARSGAPILEAHDVLSRFLTSRRNHVKPSTLTVKPAAFLPHRETTSTFHTSGLPEHEIWAIADGNMTPTRQAIGRGDIAVADVIAVGLALDPNYSPFRHVDITGWPDDAPDQLSMAQDLASRATLHLRIEAP
jgi:hypothetical protein